MQGTWVQSLVGDWRSHMLLRAAKVKKKKKGTRKPMYVSFRWKQFKNFLFQQFSLYSCSVMFDSVTPMDCSTPGFPVLHCLLEFAQTHVHWVDDTIQLSHPLSPPLLLLLSVFPSIRVFSSEWALHIRWPKYWSFSFSLSPSSECLGLISFRIDWFYLAVQGPPI